MTGKNIGEFSHEAGAKLAAFLAGPFAFLTRLFPVLRGPAGVGADRDASLARDRRRRVALRATKGKDGTRAEFEAEAVFALGISCVGNGCGGRDAEGSRCVFDRSSLFSISASVSTMNRCQPRSNLTMIDAQYWCRRT